MGTPGPRIHPAPGGGYLVLLSREERALLRALPAELEELLTTGDASLRRLFPPAYEDDTDSEDEYRRLVRDDLRDGKRHALRVLAETADAERLTEEQLHAWLTALNDLRLVLGTRVGVSEDMLLEPVDPYEPQARELALYGYLSWLQEVAVAAASTSFTE